jgi:outer membrane receptor protein involved in Fe transport
LFEPFIDQLVGGEIINCGDPVKIEREDMIKKQFKLNAVASAMLMPLASGGLALPAYAQQDGLEEIIVTATRRAGSIQDVPINISVVDAGRIQEQGLDNVADLIDFVPGINVVSAGGRNGNNIIVRGLNAEALGQGGGNDVGSTVSTYIGEIPIPLDLRLTDIERVEFLSGPQGTLYGAGTLAGAIRYIPNKPNLEEKEFIVRGDIYAIGEGDGISTDFGVTVNLPISDTFAVRGVFDRKDDKGFIDYPFVVQNPGVSEPDAAPADRAANFNPVEDADSQEISSGKLALRWQPNENLDSVLTYLRS